MKDNKMKIILAVGIALAVVMLLVVCFMGGAGTGTISAQDLSSEQKVVISEINGGQIKAYYQNEDGKKYEVNIPIAENVTVMDVNEQEIGLDELGVEDAIRVSVGDNASAEAILLLPDESRDFC